MAKTRREFTPEFKSEAVALLESSGRPQVQIDLTGILDRAE
jgi:transposase